MHTSKRKVTWEEVGCLNKEIYLLEIIRDTFYFKSPLPSSIAYDNKVSETQMKSNTVYQCVGKKCNGISRLKNASSETSDHQKCDFFKKSMSVCYTIYLHNEKYKQVKSL